MKMLLISAVVFLIELSSCSETGVICDVFAEVTGGEIITDCPESA